MHEDTNDEVMSKIERLYPRLAGIGGYEFMQVFRGKHHLVPINPSSEGYDARTISESVQKGRLYLRPIQCKLELEKKISSSDKVPIEKCLKCQNTFRLHLLREHVEECRGENENEKAGNSKENPNSTCVSSLLTQDNSRASNQLSLDEDTEEDVPTTSVREQKVNDDVDDITSPDFKRKNFTM